MNREFPSRSLASTSDLVVLAPWKKGVINADDLVSYQTRLKITFRAIFEIRRASREAGPIPLLSDPIERLEQIHSFRIRANRDGMLLAVTYDHHWEPYMRALWRDAGPFLDLLLINCEGYELSRASGVRPWAQWIRKYEVPSDYFYSATSLTVADLSALSQIERLQREDANPVAADRELAGRPSISTADTIAQARQKAPAGATDQALRILSIMFRLTRYHGANVSGGLMNPMEEDAFTLLLAARSLLAEWDSRKVKGPLRERFIKQLEWFEQDRVRTSHECPEPAKPDLAKVQRGLLTSFEEPEDSKTHITHGALLLLRITNPDEAKDAFRTFCLASEIGDSPTDGIFRTVAFTKTGLQRIGVPDASLNALGDAFVEGAAARAGQVGDIRSFHPSKWKLPGRNRPAGAKGLVPLETVDIIVVLRTAATGDAALKPDDTEHRLNAEIARIGKLLGLDLMYVEALRQADPKNHGVDHLGFKDGLSQPTLELLPGKLWSDTELASSLLILDNTPELEIFQNGSFLAIRRIEVDVNRFNTLTERAAVETGLPQKLVRAKLMGREDDGTPLVPHASANDFDFAEDAKGERCPLQSHVRRTNPRTPGQRAPRIMRRGMSFGPPVSDDANGLRGSMFMASCGDLAEQYEILLRWLNGGNSSRLGSWAADPVVGPALAGDRRLFAFPHAGRVCRLPMDDAGLPVTQLSWSIYAVVTPIDFLDRLDKPNNQQPETSAKAIDPVEEGKNIVEHILSLEASLQGDAWLAALRDPGAERTGQVDYLWAYVRSTKEKVLRIEIENKKVAYLVGSLDLVLEVLHDNGQAYSVSGAGARLEKMIGNIHLGFDAHTSKYRRESLPINTALKAIKEHQAFDLFRRITREYVDTMLSNLGAQRIDIVGDLLEPVTGLAFPDWFGIPQGNGANNSEHVYIPRGSQDWRDITKRKPTFPGDYWNIARYAFIPTPSSESGRLGVIEGPLLCKAALDWIKATGRKGLPGTVAAAIGKDTVAYPNDTDVARVLTGVLLGAVATTLGNGARVIDALAQTGDLQRLALDWRANGSREHADASKLFGKNLHSLMQSRPVPELMWRTVQGSNRKLNNVDLEVGARLILGTDSASVEEKQAGSEAYVSFGMAASGEQPPHGCPARSMALGMLLGWLAGLSEAATIKPSGAPFVLDLSPLK